MLSQMRKASPIDYAKAISLSNDFGIPTRSVIAKAVSMKDVDYTPKPKQASKQAGVTKLQLVASIRQKLNLPPRDGDLTKDDLVIIAKSVALNLDSATA